MEKRFKAQEEQSSMHKQNLLEKNANLNEILLNEKKFRESWMRKYEEEQSNHVTTSNELTEVKVNVKELNLQVKSLRNLLSDKTRYLENE